MTRKVNVTRKTRYRRVRVHFDKDPVIYAPKVKLYPISDWEWITP